MTRVCIAIVLCLCLGACGEKPGAGTAGTIILRAGHTTNVDEPYHQGLLEMARIVRERSDGRVEIHIYPSMQLGGEKAMLEGLLLGAIDIVVTANGPVSNCGTKFAFGITSPLASFQSSELFTHVGMISEP